MQLNTRHGDRACVPSHARPLLAGFAAELLLRAFWEAAFGSTASAANLRDDQLAKSRWNAATAIRWLRRRSDWTRIPLEKRIEVWGSPGPPIEVAIEHVCSFEWCCGLLGLDPDYVRANGLPFSNHRMDRPVGGLSNWRTWRQERHQRKAPPVPAESEAAPELVCT